MKTFLQFMLLISLGLFGYGVYGHFYKKSDAYIRERTVMLTSKEGQCTGVEIKSPSGRILTLTAGHCVGLFSSGFATAAKEDGESKKIKLIAEDPLSDLAVAEGVGDDFVVLAKDVKNLEKIHTMTHGGGQRLFKTEGEVIDYGPMDIPAFAIEDKDKEKECEKSFKMKQGTMPFIFGIELPTCFLHVKQILTTAKVIPGSSGGPLFNTSNDLVGIVSASVMDMFSSHTQVSDIREFLKNK